MASWLRYYDSFYERCGSQSFVTETEVVKPWMAKFDVIVDAFLTWYAWKSETKQHEAGRESHEANIPRVNEHPEVYTSAHR